jgi:hypothetical protein
MSILSRANFDNPGKSSLGIAIESAVIKVRADNIYSNVNVDTEAKIKEISKAINDELNSNYNMILVGGENAYIRPPQMDKNSPLWQKQFQKYFGEYLEADAAMAVKRNSKSIEGVIIDGRTGKYQGIAAETEVEVGLGWGILSNEKYTPEMVTACILHEIGHGDTMWRSLGHTVRSQYVMGAVQDIMLSTDSKDIKVKVLKQLAKTNDMPIQDNVEEMVKANNPDATRLVVLGGMAAVQRDELGCSGYTARGYESLADAYATIHGYGLPLNQLLMAMPGGRAAMLGTAERMADQTLTFLFWGVLGIIGPFTVPIMVLSVIFHDPEDVIYDDPYARARRVAHMQIEKLKASKGKDTDRLILDIEASIKIADMYAKSPHWIQATAEAVMPSARLNKYIREFHQMLEDLQSNPLYIKAARLNNLAK